MRLAQLVARVQVCGACLAAAIFSNIAQLINKGDARGTRYQQEQDSITEFIRFHHLPPALQLKLRAYSELSFSINRGFDMQKIAMAFPRNLQVGAARREQSLSPAATPRLVLTCRAAHNSRTLLPGTQEDIFMNLHEKLVRQAPISLMLPGSSCARGAKAHPTWPPRLSTPSGAGALALDQPRGGAMPGASFPRL